MLNQQQLLPKPAVAAITLGLPYCKRCLSFTYFGFGMGFGFGFGSGFGQPPGREEIKIYIAYKAGQLLLARQGILLFSMFLNLASFTSIRSIRWFVFFAASFILSWLLPKRKAWLPLSCQSTICQLRLRQKKRKKKSTDAAKLLPMALNWVK